VADLRTALLLCGLSTSGLALAQASFSLVADRDSVGIGEALVLTLESDEPLTEGQHWEWPVLEVGDSLAQGWEILRTGPIDSAASPSLEAGLRRTQQIEVLAWDTGFKVIEPIVLGTSGPNPITSTPLLVQVGAHTLEQNPAPRPMQGYTNFSFTWWERAMQVLPTVLSIVALCALLFWALRKFRRRGPSTLPMAQPEQPQEPAHLRALRMLEALAAEQPWTGGREKETQVVLSEAVRLHLQGTFGVKALERATEELTAHLQGAPIRGLDPKDAQWLVALLRQSDLVKFAKQSMASDAHAHAVKEAIEWVRRSAPQDQQDGEVDLMTASHG